MPLMPRLIAFLAAFAVLPAMAAEITTSLAPGGGTVIRISGPIVHADMRKAWRLLVETEHPPGRTPLVVLDSPGGDLVAGMSIMRAIARAKARTVVPDGATCASICFSAWSAGSDRRVVGTGRLGVHTASEGAIETDIARAYTLDLARSANGFGVPATVVVAMVTTVNGSIYWLSPDEIRAMTGPRP